MFAFSPSVRCLLPTLVLALACGGSTPTPQSPVDVAAVPQEAPLTAFDYFPEDTEAYVVVDVNRVFQSPYAPIVREIMTSMVTGSDGLGVSEVSAFAERLEKIYVPFGGYGRTGGMEPACIVLEGQVSVDDIRAMANRIEPDEQFNEVTVAGMRGLSVDNVLLVEVAPSRFVFGPRERVEAYVTTPPRTAVYAETAEMRSLVDADAMVVMVATQGPLLQEWFRGELRTEAAAEIEAMAISLDAMDGVTVRNRIRTQSAASSEQLATTFQTVVNGLRNEPGIAMMNLQSLIDGIEIRAEGPMVSGDMTVPDAEVQRLLQTFGALAGGGL